MSADHEFQHQATHTESSNKGQGVISLNHGSQQLSSTNNQIPQVDLLPRFHTSGPLSVRPPQLPSVDKKSAQSQFKTSLPVNHESSQLLSTNRQLLQTRSLPRTQTPVLAYPGPQPLSSTNTHLLGMDSLLNFNSSMFVNVGPQPLNRRPLSMEATPKLQAAMPINPGRPLSMEATPKLQAAMPINPGLQQLAQNNKRPAQMEQPRKAQTELFESVRSKLRESLADSLAKVLPQQNKPQTIERSGPNEVASIPGQAEEGIQSGKLSLETVWASSGTTSENSASYDHAQFCDGGQRVPSNRVSDGNTSNLLKCGVDEVQLHDYVEDEVLLSSNAIMKDELLQGHGLCWAYDLDTENAEAAAIFDSKRRKLEHEGIVGDAKEMVFQSPGAFALESDLQTSKLEQDEVTEDTKKTSRQTLQSLAVKIEAELFRLHGGVNKKYKEKARSLLFNLKDPNNPELRERVLSGEIAPDRLCSMTAEELASKELSQWRIAKAEELQQMVVLPDSEVDIRRLVKKTHKGEFQVEVEQDDSVAVEVAVGASVLSQVTAKASDTGHALRKSTDKETMEHGIPKVEKADSGEQNLSSNIAALLEDKVKTHQQGVIGDEPKDSALLPQIDSMDEYMNTFHSKHPFKNLPANSVQDNDLVDDQSSSRDKVVTLDSEVKPLSDSLEPKLDMASNSLMSKQDQYYLGSKRSSEDIDSEDPVEIARDKRVTVDEKHAGTASKGENIWEGLIQLNISSQVTVIGFFKSGEKASTKEWPSLLEIKGRVRVDAFEKFLQELPLSRSRAIMIIQFCWKQGYPENGRLNLCETIDSYITDERVGFAEPAPGVELYFCPPHKRTTEMLGKHLSKEQMETLQSAAKGDLIGVAVWRRPHVTISPKLSSQHKHSSTKKQLNSRRQNISSNSSRPSQSSYGLPPSNPEPSIEEPIDDVPPGFGPANFNDEDDLPEFDFRRTTPAPNPSQPFSVTHSHGPWPRAADQMRELVHKYGQSQVMERSGVERQTWNDDDDDIPEWQPHQDRQTQLHPLPPQPPSVVPQFNGYQQLAQQPFFASQQTMPAHSPQQPLAQPQFPPHQLVSFVAPMPAHLQPSLQSPMGQIPSLQNMRPGWQVPPPQGSAQVGFLANDTMQPYHFHGAPNNVQFYGVPGFGAGQDGTNWRPDIPGSRGI